MARQVGRKKRYQKFRLASVLLRSECSVRRKRRSRSALGDFARRLRKEIDALNIELPSCMNKEQGAGQAVLLGESRFFRNFTLPLGGMSILFLLTPTPMPSNEKSGGGGERILPVSSSPLSQASNTPSQASFKSYSPLLNPTSPNHSRPFRRHCLGFIKTLLWTVSLIILTIIFVSRPAILPHSHSRSHPRPTKVATAASNLTLTQYIDSHFPRDLPESQTPHLWITLADHEFAATGTANLDIFFKQLNVERKDYYARKRRDVRDSVIVTICLDEGCVKECFERDMYCYEGFESRRPPEVSPPCLYCWHNTADLVSSRFCEFRATFPFVAKGKLNFFLPISAPLLGQSLPVGLFVFSTATPEADLEYLQV